MKRKNLHLDFTSLLDVIMIILFVVLANLSESTVAAVEEAETESQIVQSENEFLRSENKELEEKLIEINNDATENTAIYESVIDDMTKVSLICDTQVNTETGNPEVIVSVYIDDKDENRSSVEETITLVHELGLSSSERQILYANQITEATETLTNILEVNNSPIIWFILQYDYRDSNFTYADLNVLNSAINNIEIALSTPCYLEEINISKE